MVSHREFADAKAFGVRKDRRESVQFAIDPDVSHDIVTIDLEAAVEVV
jgi:hypothetical protein